VKRMASLGGLRPLGLVGALVVLGALVVGAAQGEGAHHKRPTLARVLSNQQQTIVDSGRILVKLRGTAGKRFRVDGFTGRRDRGRLTRSSKEGKGGEFPLRLVGHGRQLLGGCDIDFLKVVNAKAKHKKQRGRRRGKPHAATPLQHDLAACNPGGGGGGGGTSPRCDPLDPTVCLQPWPNDYFTRADATTDTGRRLDLRADQMPANTSGVHIDPTDIDRADGFSPGNLITLKIPQVDTQAAFDQTGFVSITDPGSYTDPNQPVVVIDADTGDRQPIFAELDPNPNLNQPGDTQDVNLIIRPLRNFTEGHRYIVVLRNLKDAAGNPVPAPASFRVYRDSTPTSDSEVEARRPHMEDVLTTLTNDGFARSSLYMAWDFTVASEHSLAGRALAIRDDALSHLGDTTPGDGQLDGSAPAFHITNVETNPANLPANTLEQVDGELTDVPCYLNNGDCHPGGTFNFHANGDVNATSTGIADDPDAATTGVRFRCLIPNSAVSGGTLHPTQSGIFGHGLLGDFTQVGDMIKFTPSEANITNTSWCATNWAGFSSDDLGTVIGVLGDVSKFPQMGDRMLQGFVNMIYLGRAMTMGGGFDTDPAFQIDPDGGNPNPAGSVLATGPGNLFWEGISQGAIMGGALTALEPDLTQSVLNVTGMNYSTLLRRSSDSGQYLDTPNLGLWAHYPNLQQRPLILSLMQLLWDRGEANGYAEHMASNPLPGTPAHHVLLQMAYGDHQVSNLAGEVEARTIGAQVHTPELDPGRHWASDPLFELTPIPSLSYPYSGNAAMVYYDGGPLDYATPALGTPVQTCTDENNVVHHGTAPAPLVELPPNPVSVFGCDPHSYPRRSVDGVTHDTTWLRPSGFIDQCVDPGPVARPCYSNGYTGP
jgi:hypothetical protein